MEREYTIGAVLVLITIFVMALIIYFTVPSFSESVRSIADEVFGISVKAAEQMKEEYEIGAATNVLKDLNSCVDACKEKKERCVCYINFKDLPEGYSIKTFQKEQNGPIFLTLEKGNLKVKDAEEKSLAGLNFGILKNLKECGSNILGFEITSKDGKIRLGAQGKEYEFPPNAPEIYNFQGKDSTIMCFVTTNLKEEDVISTRAIEDCKTGKKEMEERVKMEFQSFIQMYKNCKEQDTIGECRCGEFDFGDIPKPYGVRVLQSGGKTTFSLENTEEKEVITDNLLMKISGRIWNLLGYKLEDYQENERLEGKQRIVHYGGKRNIYLAQPSAVQKMSFCFKNVNVDLKFNKGITEEEYKQRILKLFPKAEPYFKTVYEVAKKNDVDLFMVAAMIQQESSWNPKAVSKAGAAGLMQLMPCTAIALGLEVPCKTLAVYKYCKLSPGKCVYKEEERFDPNKNIQAGTRYINDITQELNKNKIDPTFENILASYNAGPGAVKKYKGVPPYGETKDYVKRICGFYEQMNTKVCYA
ncbi:MAG: lytic transglycosylase domain-containing protein [Nanoarchaeota archaeon]|nr:lytic transglycosylase domain-containing protein [Nanoarchaeota archaeon]